MPIYRTTKRNDLHCVYTIWTWPPRKFQENKSSEEFANLICDPPKAGESFSSHSSRRVLGQNGWLCLSDVSLWTGHWVQGGEAVTWLVTSRGVRALWPTGPKAACFGKMVCFLERSEDRRTASTFLMWHVEKFRHFPAWWQFQSGDLKKPRNWFKANSCNLGRTSEDNG